METRTNTNALGWRKLALGVALSAALVAGPVAGAHASTLQANTVTVQSSVGAASSAATLDLRVAPATPSNAAVTSLTNGAEKRGWVGPVLDWIKKNAAGIWDAMVKAVKAGWKAFQKWWNGLAGWIRGGIEWIVSGGVWEIFSGLWDYFT